MWDGQVTTKVLVAGQGPPLVYFHGALGLMWDPFLEFLASTHTVYAPYLPGTAPGGDPNAVKPLESLWDLVLCYEEILDALNLDRVVAVGHSFGGMMAAEVAAHVPSRVSKLVLIAPIGLWRDSDPWQNPGLMSLPEMAEAAFYYPTGPVAAGLLTLPSDEAAQAEVILAITWAMACAANFFWPLPDKGLDRRLHRVTAPTLILWGEGDKIVSPAYAGDFAARIGGSRYEVLPAAAHLPQLEQFADASKLVGEFLSG